MEGIRPYVMRLIATITVRVRYKADMYNKLVDAVTHVYIWAINRYRLII